MKNGKRLMLLLFVLFLFTPCIVHARTKTYDICKSGCEYNNILNVWQDINRLESNYDVVINFKDNGPYSFLDDFEDINFEDDDFETYEVPLVVDYSTYYGYACDDNGTKIYLNDDRVYDYNTRIMKCYLIEEEDYWETSTFLFNSQLNSITVNGYKDGKTTIDVVGSLEEGSLFKGLERLFFTGFANAKEANYNNINLIGSFYVGAQSSMQSRVYANNCDFNYGILAYNSDLTITNSSVHNVYSLGNTKVWLSADNNYVNGRYEFLQAPEATDYSELDEEMVEAAYESFMNQVVEAEEEDASYIAPFINLLFNSIANETRSNFFEIDDSQIIMSKEKTVVSMTVAGSASIENELTALVGQEYEIIIEDESICSIENGIIIPKKNGTTAINIKTTDGTYYRIQVNIADFANPKTGFNICLLILLLLSIVGFSSLVFNNKKTHV